MNARGSARAPFLVFLAAFLFLFAGATQRDLWTTGEHRYAEVARTMTSASGDAVVPHLNGEVYPDKPPGFFWVAGAFHRLGIGLPVAAKLPSMLGGAFTVMLAFALARRWYGGAAGLVAAGVLATTNLFGWAARTAQLDAFLTAIITAVLYCFARADETPREDWRRRSLWAALGFLAVGAGIMVKGPPAPAIPAITILVFLLWTTPRGLLTPKLLWGFVLAALPGLLWLWPAFERAGGAYVNDLLRGHAIGHAAGEIDKVEHWHFYLWNVPLALLPWVLLLPAAIHGVIVHGRPGERRSDRFLVAWLVAPWLLFSLFPAKRDLYLLPIHPPAALLVARLFRDWIEVPSFELRWSKLPRRLVAGAMVFAGVIAAIASLLVLFSVDRTLGEGRESLARWWEGWEFMRAELTAIRLLVACGLAAAIAWAGVAAWRAKTAPRAMATLLAAVGGWALLDAVVLAPARDAGQSPRAFLEEVRQRAGEAPLVRLGGDGGLQYAVNWVLEREAVEQTRSSSRAAAFLASDASPRYVVTDAKELLKSGEVAGAHVLLRRDRLRNLDLILLGNAAAAAER